MGVLQTAKRPVCWLKQHQWLLQEELPVAWLLNEDDTIGDIHETVNWYGCERCGKYDYTVITHIKELT